jgi:hypothetical protein
MKTNGAQRDTDKAFNRRLALTIEDYWRLRGYIIKPVVAPVFSNWPDDWSSPPYKVISSLDGRGLPRTHP